VAFKQPIDSTIDGNNVFHIMHVSGGGRKGSDDDANELLYL